MTIQRFSVLVMNPMGELEPGTLSLDTESSRADTLKAEIRSTRGRGGVMFEGESFKERVVQANAPQGHVPVEFVLDEEGKRTFRVFTVVSGEIVNGSRQLRKSKPRVPVSKFSRDEILTCCGCGQQAMARGSDNVGWKGIQMFPGRATFDYYCTKTACIELRDRAIDMAKINWGYTDPAPPQVVEQNEG